MDKLIPDALPLFEAPPVVRLVHLYKLLCAISFDRFSSSNALPLRAFLKQETGKPSMEPCEGSFVADATTECGVQPISPSKFGPSARMRFDLQLNRPPFLGHYKELHHADVSLIINNNADSQLGLVQRSDGARHIRNSVRELSGQASCFPHYKEAITISLLVQHVITENCFLRR